MNEEEGSLENILKLTLSRCLLCTPLIIGTSYLSGSEFLIPNIYIPVQIDTLCIKAGVAVCRNNQRSYVLGDCVNSAVILRFFGMGYDLSVLRSLIFKCLVAYPLTSFPKLKLNSVA
jgi:hypothetical protein